MNQHKSWERLGRRTVYDTPHLRVYEDTVKLPDGSTMDDYSIVEFNDVVMAVATDTDGNIIMLQEYRYAHDQTMWNLPAGTFRRGQEDPSKAVARELLEETGYSSSEVKLVGEVYEYPTKTTHTIHVFRIRNARKTAPTEHEASEHILVQLLRPEEVRKLVLTNQVRTASSLSSLVLAMPELFGGEAG